MAKRLLLGVLTDSLGQYIEGLSGENLKVGVWSGKIELKNLALKVTALEGLNLPIAVKRGVLKTLKLSVPWTSLESKPVQVHIDGLLLQVSINVVEITKTPNSKTAKAAANTKPPHPKKNL